MDKYSFGKCKICDKEKALRNEVCSECNKGTELPECLKEIFGGFRK
jgi:hypothetical protein